ncbi:MAG: Regulator of chromosome condensation repeat-containing protein [Gemmatimonadetes bacterium]|nr:Regulator of chromosome condensation repeat-containing protein [Gemmatimonadota bacterium]
MIAALSVAIVSCDLRPTSPLAVPKEDPKAPKVAGGPPAQAYNIASVPCVANVATLSVQCGKATLPSSGTLPDIIIGSQNVYVTLTSSNAAYNSGTGQFTFNTTVTNLIPQKLGTADGTTLDPNGVRVFFDNGPTATAGSGTVSVVPDGFATFTASGQPYYQYNNVLAQNVTSAAKGWTLIMPPTVGAFAFDVYVSAPVQFPNGYVDIAPIGSLIHPDVTTPLTFSVKTAVGNAISGQTVTWSAADLSVATVDAAGVITSLKGGTTLVTGTDGVRTNSVTVNVSGANRSWGGATNTQYTTGTNWPLHNIVPVSSDTVTVPTGAANMPVLTGAASLDGVVMQATTTFNLSTFDLTIAKAVTMAATGAITASSGRVILSGGTVDGTLPTTRVDGAVTTSGTMVVSGTIQVNGGTLKSVGNTITVH